MQSEHTKLTYVLCFPAMSGNCFSVSWEGPSTTLHFVYRVGRRPEKESTWCLHALVLSLVDRNSPEQLYICSLPAINTIITGEHNLRKQLYKKHWRAESSIGLLTCPTTIQVSFLPTDSPSRKAQYKKYNEKIGRTGLVGLVAS